MTQRDRTRTVSQLSANTHHAHSTDCTGSASHFEEWLSRGLSLAGRKCLTWQSRTSFPCLNSRGSRFLPPVRSQPTMPPKKMKRAAQASREDLAAVLERELPRQCNRRRIARRSNCAASTNAYEDHNPPDALCTCLSCCCHSHSAGCRRQHRAVRFGRPVRLLCRSCSASAQ